MILYITNLYRSSTLVHIYVLKYFSIIFLCTNHDATSSYKYQSRTRKNLNIFGYLACGRTLRICGHFLRNFAKFSLSIFCDKMRYFLYYTSKNEIPLIVILALPLISGPGKQYFAILCDISYITLLKTRYLSY